MIHSRGSVVTCVLLGCLGAADAAVLQVDRADDDPAATACDDATPADCSLRGAILSANALAGADLIDLPAGTYTLTVPGPGEDAGTADDLDILTDLTITGAGSEDTVIEACAVDQKTAPCPAGQGIAHRVVHLPAVFPRLVVQIGGVTIRNGRFADGSGGALENLGNDLLLTDVVVSDSFTSIGGGIYSVGTLRLDHSAVTGNVATGDGGGIYAAIFATGEHLTLTDSLVSDNRARNGGGIYGAGPVNLVRSTVSRNTAGNGGLLTFGPTTFTDSTISDNIGEGGSGGARVGGALVATNSTISGNRDSSSCGGLVLQGTPAELSNVTIVDNTNTSGDGGGICSFGATEVRNSIIAGNHAGATSERSDCDGFFSTQGFNLVGVGCTGFADGIAGDRVGTFASPIDPGLGALADNGGPTETHALLATSPAIDTGDPAGCRDSASTLLVADQRGEPRPLDGDGDGTAACDVGAFESDGGSTLPFAVRSIRPGSGGNSGLAVVSFYGSGFVDGMTVKLARAGEPDIPGDPLEIHPSGIALSTVFDLAGRAVGSWDAVVTAPGGATATLPGAFTVEGAGRAELWADVVGPFRFRALAPMQHVLTFGNRGNVTALGVPLVIAVPKIYEHRLDFEVAPPPPQSGQAAIDWQLVPATMGSGELPNHTVIALFLPAVPPGFTGTLSVRLSAPLSEAGTVERLFFSIGAPYFQSPLAPEVAANLVKGARAYARRVLDVGIPVARAPEMAAYVTTQLEEAVRLGLLSLTSGDPEPFAIPQLIVDLAAAFVGGSENCSNGLDDDGDQLADLADPDCQFEDDQDDDEGEDDREEPGEEECDPGEAANPWYADDDCDGEPDCKEGGFDTCLKEPGKPWGPRDDDDDDGGGGGGGFRDLLPLASWDPNEKIGAAGAGEGRFVSGAEPLRYAVSFENLPSATAPAQEVVITDPLDPTAMDLATLSLGPIAFADRQVVPPPGLSSFTTDVDLRPAQDLLVRIEASLDVATSVLTWRFTSLDPDTGAPPADPDAGFLPPNQSPPEGQGNVFFTVDPLDGLPTGTEIRNRASIVFDLNPAIVTAEWLNTIDIEDPVSQVTSAAAPACSQAIRVSWSGSDPGSGIASYDVAVAEDGGEFTLWQDDAVETSGTFYGEWGKSYAFRSTARDRAGNLEDLPATPDATATVEDCGPYDLAVTKIIAPKVVALSDRKPAPTKLVKLQIQNRSAAAQTIPSLDVLRAVVDLEVLSLGGACPDPTPVLLAGKPQKKRPITLGSKKKLSVVFAVTFGCANDPAKNKGGETGHEDFELRARIDQSALGGTDAFAADDACPRTVPPPGVVVPYPDGSIEDKGCGAKKPDKTFGAPVLIDVVDKR
jgi:hypothetical protein